MLDQHRRKFEAIELAERQQLADRKKIDPVILIHPDQAPELLFEPPYSFKTFRMPEQLAVIEDRLRKLGFEIERNGNVVAYRLLHGNKWMVLADPRSLNEFEFRLFKRSGKYQWNGLRKDPRYFRLRETKNWPEKFQQWLNTEIA